MDTLGRTPARLVAALVAVAVLLGGCGNDTDDTGDSAGGTAQPTVEEIPWGTEWGATEVVRDGQAVDLVGDSRLTLRFHEDGRTTAHAGCNTLIFDGVSLRDGELWATGGVGTEMGCGEELATQEDWFAGFLGAKPTWTRDDATLVLATDDTEVRFADRDVAVPDAPLDGTRWVLDALVDEGGPDGAVSSVPDGVEAFVEFDDGHVYGNAGCNEFGGDAVVDGDTITFAEIYSTLMGCGSPRGTVEEAVHEVADGTVTFAVDGDRLTLTHPSGRGLVFVAAG